LDGIHKEARNLRVYEQFFRRQFQGPDVPKTRSRRPLRASRSKRSVASTSTFFTRFHGAHMSFSFSRVGVLLTLSVACTAAAQSIRVQGSAAGYGISRAAVAAFDAAQPVEKDKPRLSLHAGVTGAALGFADLCSGEAQLVQSSRPIQKHELDACARARVDVIELPIALDAIAVIVHAKNAFLNSVTMDDLRTAWELKAQGRINRWSHVNPAWPDAPMQLVGPDRLSDEARFINAALLSGGVARQDYMSSAEDNIVAQAVARDVAAFGLVSAAYYFEARNRLRAVPVSFAQGSAPVAPTPDAVTRGAYRPLTRPVFLYVSARALDQPHVARFAEYYVSNAARFAKEQNYVPLSPALYAKALDNLRARVKGTMWDGAAAGITLDALQQKYGAR
jgi:phosphate transport system substrate-binding protein